MATRLVDQNDRLAAPQAVCPDGPVFPALNLVLLLLILLVAAASRFYGINTAEGVRGDDAAPDYFSAYIWLEQGAQFFGAGSDLVLRSVSAFAGVMLVGALFVVGRKHLSPAAALMAATWVAGSSQAIVYSRAASPVMGGLLCFLLAFHFFRAVVIEKDQSRKNIIGLGLFMVANGYWHDVGRVFDLGLLLVYGLLCLRQRENYSLKIAAKIFLPALLLLAPVWPDFFAQLTNHIATTEQNFSWLPIQGLVWSVMFGPDSVQVVFYQGIFCLTLVAMMVWLFNPALMPETVEKKHYLQCALAVCLVPLAFVFFQAHTAREGDDLAPFLFILPFMALIAGYWVDRVLVLFPGRGQILFQLIFIVGLLFYQAVVNHSLGLYQ